MSLLDSVLKCAKVYESVLKLGLDCPGQKHHLKLQTVLTMRRAGTTNPQGWQRREEALQRDVQNLSKIVDRFGELEAANNALLNQILQGIDEISDGIEELQNAIGVTTAGKGGQKQTSSQLLELLTEINKKAIPPPIWQIILFGALGSVIGAFVFTVLVAILIKLDIRGPFFQR